MNPDEALRAALSKIAAEKFVVPKARTGRRSISIDNLLKKEKDGTLLKATPNTSGDSMEATQHEMHVMKTAFLHELGKIASNLSQITKEAMPPMAQLLGKMPLPLPPKVPQLLNTALGQGLGTFTRHTPVAATAANMAAATVRPGMKLAGLAGTVGKALGAESAIGKHLLAHHNAYDLGGLGVLAAPAVDTLQHELRKGPDKSKREMAHAGLEIGGLGTLAAPVAMAALAARKGLH